MKTKRDSHRFCSCDNKVPIGICDCTADSDVGKGDILLVQGILCMCGHTQV